MRLLTVRQPWAWLIVHGSKTTEWRSWSTDYRGDLLIHAAAKPASNDEVEKTVTMLRRVTGKTPRIRYAGIIGVVEIFDVVPGDGGYHWQLRYPQPVEFMALRGRLGLWSDPAIDDRIVGIPQEQWREVLYL